MRQRPTRTTKTTRSVPATRSVRTMPRTDRQLLQQIGRLADRVIRTCTPTVDEETPLLRQALAAAAAVEQRMAAQQARIAYLETLSQTDELTGLHNRRGFNEHLRRVLASAKRYGDQGVVIFCDLDDFKAVNDTYGHAVGDKVLKRIGDILKESVRETDVIARLGGDEFGIILAQTTWRNGYKRAQVISRLIERNPVTIGRKTIRVDASLGIEPFGPNDEADNLIARADMAMYYNKRKKASVAFVTAAE